MKLAPQDVLDRLVATFPGIEEDRKRFLVEYVADATPDRLAQVLTRCPAIEADFLRACLAPTSAAA